MYLSIRRYGLRERPRLQIHFRRQYQRTHVLPFGNQKSRSTRLSLSNNRKYRAIGEKLSSIALINDIVFSPGGGNRLSDYRIIFFLPHFSFLSLFFFFFNARISLIFSNDPPDLLSVFFNAREKEICFDAFRFPSFYLIKMCLYIYIYFFL